MVERRAPGSPAVSLSRPLGSETPRHPTFRRDSAETIAETSDLKALARLVLARDTRRDTARDILSRPDHLAETPSETPETPAPSWGEAEEERAAIVEYNGGIPRAWAEGFARLHPDCPPGDVPSKRWMQFVDDVGRFLDSDFATVAAALGWGPFDLFGCDRDRPFARVDHAGRLLNGDKLVELDCHRAVIERCTGSRQTFRRRPVAVGEVVLAWELAR